MEFLISNNFFTLDHVIVYGFLLTILIVGVYVGRKVKNLKEYILADKSLGTITILLSLVATGIGGSSSTGLAANVYKDGILPLISYLGFSLSLVIIAYIVVPRMITFKEDEYTIADVMRRFYGEKAGIFTGMIGFLSGLLNIGSQIMALGMLTETLLGTSSLVGILFGGLILIIYTSFGGIKSVAITDILEFIVLIVIIPIVANLVIMKAGGLTSVLKQSPVYKFDILKHPNFKLYLTIFIVHLLPSCSLAPDSVQRIMMARSRTQIKNIFLIYAGISAAFFTMISLIGFAGFALSPNSESSMIFPNIVKTVLPIGLKGFAVAGLFSVIMSTGDSILNISSILLVHNTIVPISKKLKMNLRVNPLILTKAATLLMGIISMSIAYFNKDVLKINFYALSIFSITISIPFLMAFIGMKGDALSFFVTTIISIASFIIVHLAFQKAEISILSGTIVNIVVFFLFHIIKNKGFKFIERSWQEERNIKESLTFDKIKKCIFAFRPTPRNVLKYAEKNIRIYGSNHIAFGAFFCLNYIVPIFLWNHQPTENVAVMTTFRFIGGLLSVGLILEKSWPIKLKKLFPLYWYITVGYCLPFVSTAMYILMGASTEWLVNIALTTMLLAWLIDWKNFIILLLIGSSLGIIFGYYYLEESLSWYELFQLHDISSKFLFLYTIAFACFIGIVFFRKKDNDIRKKLASLKLMGGSLAHEVKNIIGIDSTNSMLLSLLFNKMKIKEKNNIVNLETTKEDLDKIKSSILNIGKGSIKGLENIKQLLLNMSYDVNKDEYENINIKKLLREVLDEYDFTDIQRKNIHLDINDDFEFKGPKAYLKQVFFNLFKNSYKFAREDCKIEIWNKDRKVYFRDNGLGIKKNELPYIFDYFFTTTSTSSGIGLPFAKMVMEKIGGDIICETKTTGKSYTMLVLSFPKNK